MTSVAVVVRDLPARIRNGTSVQLLRVDLEPQRARRFRHPSRRRLLFLAVALILAADHVGGLQSARIALNTMTFSSRIPSTGIAAGRFHHRPAWQRPGACDSEPRRGSPASSSKSHRDPARRTPRPDVICTLSMQLRFQIGSRKLVGETERKNIENGFFAQIMVDPEDSRFLEGRLQYAIELASGFFIMTERLLDHRPALFPWRSRTRPGVPRRCRKDLAGSPGSAGRAPRFRESAAIV